MSYKKLIMNRNLKLMEYNTVQNKLLIKIKIQIKKS